METQPQPWQDTPQQKAIMRQNRMARKVRAQYPFGKRVSSGQMEGTVYRHVPGSNSQGGHVMVDWDNGVRSRMSPIALRQVESPARYEVRDTSQSGRSRYVVWDTHKDKPVERAFRTPTTTGTTQGSFNYDRERAVEEAANYNAAYENAVAS